MTFNGKFLKYELNLAKEFPNWKVLLPRWWIEMKVNTEAIPIANLRVLAMRKCKSGMEGSSEMLICMNKTICLRMIIDRGRNHQRMEQTDTPPTLAPFTKVKFNAQMDDFEPIMFLKQFIDDEFVQLLVTQTYMHSSVYNKGTVKQKSRLGKWQPVTLHEMMVFLSLIICMGLIEKRELSVYWSTDFVVDTPFFKKYMTRDRFQSILLNLHITDNTKAVLPGEPGFDPLYKIRPFVTLLNKFNVIYNP